MSEPAKIVLGLLSIVPLLYVFAFMAFMVSALFGFIDMTQPVGSGPPRGFLLFLAAHLGVMFLSFVLTAFYVVYLFRTDRVEQDKKALWAVVLFLGNIFAFPVFWRLYIWRNFERKPAA